MVAVPNLLLPRWIQSDFGKRANNEVAIFQRAKASKPSVGPAISYGRERCFGGRELG